jgi:hypothetical protein
MKTIHRSAFLLKVVAAISLVLIGCPLFYDPNIVGSLDQQPEIILNTPTAGASHISGTANNIDIRVAKVVGWALTNRWYVQPLIDSPYTSVSSDGSWSMYTHHWDRFVALLVDETYVPGSTRTYHPSLDPGVLAWAEYPSTGPATIGFSGRTWGIKVSADRFDPGPNYWSNDPENVWVDGQGLHLKVSTRGGKWYCAEVALPQSLGYGTYTIQLASPVGALDQYCVFGAFLYESSTREIDFEAAGSALIPSPNNTQFVVQPYTRSGNLHRFVSPNETQTTIQIAWQSSQIAFTFWRGWNATPGAGDTIESWTYTGPDVPPAGGERFHFNLWLFGGSAPVNGVGNEVVVGSFAFRP